MQNMLTQLVEHERIETTLPKAKMLKHEMERMVNLSKQSSEYAMNQLQKSFRVLIFDSLQNQQFQKWCK